MDYQKRLCPFRKAIASLFTPQTIQYLHHEKRIPAFGIVLKKEENAPYVQAILECVLDNGEPVPQAKALREGLSWAKKLNAANIKEARAMEREYETLIEQHPDDYVYKVLALIVRGKISDIDIEEMFQETNKLYPEGRLFQAELVEKAQKGDVAVQLEVARRLETGDKFRHDKAKAYYWYKRAQQNKGGEPAQKGLDRLLPQLKKIDRIRIESWLENKLRMY